MDSKFSVEDIKRHLRDLGYTNVPEEKLVTFVSDLRRLMKYEERKKLADKKLKDIEKNSPGRKRSQRRRRVKSACYDDTESMVSGSKSNTQTNFSTSRSTTSSVGMRSKSVNEKDEEPSLYVDVLLPRDEPVDRPGVSLLQPSSGVIRCRSTQASKTARKRDSRTDPVRLHQGRNHLS